MFAMSTVQIVVVAVQSLVALGCCFICYGCLRILMDDRREKRHNDLRNGNN